MPPLRLYDLASGAHLMDLATGLKVSIDFPYLHDPPPLQTDLTSSSERRRYAGPVLAVSLLPPVLWLRYIHQALGHKVVTHAEDEMFLLFMPNCNSCAKVSWRSAGLGGTV